MHVLTIQGKFCLIQFFCSIKICLFIRCYLLTKGGDTKSFLKDFGLTAACSLLKWVVRNNITGESKIVSDSGKIPVSETGKGKKTELMVLLELFLDDGL